MIADLPEDMALAVACEQPPSPSLCDGVQGNHRLGITTLVTFPQGGGVKRAMLPMPEPQAMAASVSRYRVVQVDVRALFDKSRLVVRGHVT